MTDAAHVAAIPADYLLALLRYLFPAAPDVAGRDAARLEAVLEMRRIARTLAVEVHPR